MTWTAPERSAEARALYAAAEDDRTVRPDRYALAVEPVVDRATAGGEQPTSDFAPGWESGLRAYLDSAEADGRLNALGRRMVQDTAVGRLRAGARVADAVATRGGREPALTPPIVIIGGWRTGTTFLFRLLARDERLHAPLPAELSAPWRFAGLEREARQEAIERAAGAHEFLHLLNPTMAAVHDSGPRLAEECVLAMGTDLRNWGFTSTVRLDGYAEWLAGQDLAGSYRRYRTALALLDDGDERRFVLKAPAHTAELDHLVATFPGAVVVHLHRDIVETVASGASLFAVFRSTYSDEVDASDVGRFQTVQTERWFRRAQAFRAAREAAAATFVDLEYRDVVADPAAALRAVYRAADMAAPADIETMIADYHVAHPRHAHGVHRYAPGDFGLVPDELRERFSFLAS